MKKSQMNVVSIEQVWKERGLKCRGLKWTLSQMNHLKWMVSNDLVSIVTERSVLLLCIRT